MDEIKIPSSEPVDIPQVDDRQPVQMQRVFIKFSNGKVAVFSGPAVFSSTEMKLVTPNIVDLAFSEPFEVMMKVPTAAIPVEEKK